MTFPRPTSRRSSLEASVLAIVAALWAACSSPVPASLVVQLRSDMEPEVEIDHVTTLVSRAGDVVWTGELDVTSGAALSRGVRISSIDSLAPGTYEIVVTLSRRGVERQRREARAQVVGAHFVTLLMTRDCNGVACPGVGGDPTSIACLGGRCVDPTCTEETPELCASPECAADAECTSGLPSCVVGSCSASGTCLAEPDVTRCDDAQVCDTTSG